MKIYLSYVAARERATGRLWFLAEICNLVAGAPVAPVAYLAAMFRDPGEEGAELRAKYSHTLVVIDNIEREALELPDPAIAERERLTRELAKAEQAAADARAVEQAAKAHTAQLKELAAETKAANAVAAELKKRLDAVELLPTPPPPSEVPIERPQQSPVLPPAPPVAPLPQRLPGEPTPAEQIAALDDAALAKVAAEYGIPAPEAGNAGSRKAVIDLILEAAAKAAGGTN